MSTKTDNVFNVKYVICVQIIVQALTSALKQIHQSHIPIMLQVLTYPLHVYPNDFETIMIICDIGNESLFFFIID